MKNNVLLIVGLPGSGKTSWAIQNMCNKNYHLIDDPKSIDLDIKPFLGSDLIVCDPHLCNKKTLNYCIDYFKSNNYDVKVLYFDNNKEQALINSKKRNKKVVKFIDIMSRIYNPPRVDLKVYKE